MIIIGLAGRAQVGKDTTADYLVKKYDFKKTAFATYVKQVAELGSWNGLKDERGRRYLQHLGDVMREYNPNIMIDELLAKIKNYEIFCEANNKSCSIVISDVRLLNEIEALKNIGASLWLIKRNTDTSIIPAHATEQIDEKSFNFDYVFDNNGSFTQLYNGIDQAILEHAQKR